MKMSSGLTWRHFIQFKTIIMKIKMYLFKPVLIMSFIVAFVSCQTGVQKEQEAVEDVAEAKQDLKEVIQENKEDNATAATTEEWNNFKAETDARILENEKKMKALSDQIKKEGKNLDALYARKIDTLQMKNRVLKNKLDGYDMKSDWKKFQQEFNRDMDELGKTLKDFTVKN